MERIVLTFLSGFGFNKNYFYKLIFFLFVAHCSLFFDHCKAQWIKQNSGTNQNLYDIEFINEKTGWAVGDAGVVIKTTDGGANWINIPNPSPQLNPNLWSIAPIDSNIVYIVSGKDLIIKTSNGGLNWDILNFCGTCNSAMTGVHFLNKDTGWFLGSNKVFRTYNGGLTLDSFYVPWFTNFEIYFKDVNTGIFCGTGRVFKSIDGGMTWYDTNVPVNGSFPFFRKLAQYDDNIWVGGGNKIYKSTNFGNNWIISDSSIGAFAITFLNEITGYLGGGSNLLYKTTNGGFNWYQQRTDSTSLAFISSIAFTNDSIGWYSCGAGRIYKTTTAGHWLTNINLNLNLHVLPKEFSLYQNYPNPSTTKRILNLM